MFGDLIVLMVALTNVWRPDCVSGCMNKFWGPGSVNGCIDKCLGSDCVNGCIKKCLGLTVLMVALTNVWG